jgi:hypothetical protein
LNKVLELFGLKREQKTRGWEKLHAEQLYNLYFSQCVTRRSN